MANIEDLIQALHAELRFDFVRASGPGGQNVNKVATAAQLHFHVQRSTMLPDEIKLRLRQLAGRRMTAEGMLVIEARRYRTQEQNRDDAIRRFDTLVGRAMESRKARVATHVTAAAREKRLQSKKRKGEVKRSRQRRSLEL